MLPRSLKQDCETRWNTKLDMMAAVLFSYDEVMDILQTRGEWHRMRNTSKETLQMLVKFLQPFKDATLELSGSKYPTMNRVVLWKSKLMANCQPSASDTTAMEVLKRRCLQLLDARIQVHDHAKLAVLLSPKFKQLRMFSQQEKEAIYDLARVELSNFPPPEEQEQQMETSQSSQAMVTEEELETGAAAPFSEWEDQEDHEAAAESDEVDRYLQLKITPLPPTMGPDGKLQPAKEETVLAFWKRHAKSFPKMARLAKKILCVPATSVSCEATFSKSGRTLEERRTQLGTATVNALLFLNSNM